MHDDPSMHDVPRPTELFDGLTREQYFDEHHGGSPIKEINFGPVVNPDGSPSTFTKAMFGVKSDEDERTRHEARIHELLEAIRNDVEDLLVSKYSGDQRQLTLLGIRECANDAYNLGKRINQIQWDKMTELRNQLLCVDCNMVEEFHDSRNHPFRNANGS